jgi:hypothetical protein
MLIVSEVLFKSSIFSISIIALKVNYEYLLRWHKRQ